MRGKEAGLSGEPVDILFRMLFQYTSSWYTFWLVNYDTWASNVIPVRESAHFIYLKRACSHFTNVCFIYKTKSQKSILTHANTIVESYQILSNSNNHQRRRRSARSPTKICQFCLGICQPSANRPCLWRHRLIRHGHTAWLVETMCPKWRHSWIYAYVLSLFTCLIS